MQELLLDKSNRVNKVRLHPRLTNVAPSFSFVTCHYRTIVQYAAFAFGGRQQYLVLQSTVRPVPFLPSGGDFLAVERGAGGLELEDSAAFAFRGRQYLVTLTVD
eukprot:8072470-Pyramimonas_sp.AAC.1